MADDYDPLVIFNVVSEDRRPLAEEYVELLAVGNVDLDGYALVDRDFGKDVVRTSEFHRLYAFPALHLRAGDVVILRSGAGQNNVIDRGYGLSIHILYWGVECHVWRGRSGDQATLIKYSVEFSQTI